MAINASGPDIVVPEKQPIGTMHLARIWLSRTSPLPTDVAIRLIDGLAHHIVANGAFE